MITFVCWKWTDPRAGRSFSSSHVNVLARAIARNYSGPHRLVCITDEPDGLDPKIVHLPMPVTGFEHLTNPSARARHEVYLPARRVGGHYRPPVHRVRQPKPFPSCYRRLWMWSEQARALLGPRIFALDIDVIVLGDLTPLVDRPGSFVGWTDERFGWRKIAGGAYLMDTGAHPEVFTDFDPEHSPAIAKAAGFEGSDQAWISYKLFERIPSHQHWPAGALTKLKWVPVGDKPSASARLVFTSGDSPPWDPEVQRRYPWIKEHWR